MHEDFEADSVDAGHTPPLTRYEVGCALWHQLMAEGKPSMPLVRMLHDLSVSTSTDMLSAPIEDDTSNVSPENAALAIEWAAATIKHDDLRHERAKLESLTLYFDAVRSAKMALVEGLSASLGRVIRDDEAESLIANYVSLKKDIEHELAPLKPLLFEMLRQKIMAKMKTDRENESPYEKHMREFRETPEGKERLAAMRRRDEIERRQMHQIRATIAHIERRHKK